MTNGGRVLPVPTLCTLRSVSQRKHNVALGHNKNPSELYALPSAWSTLSCLERREVTILAKVIDPSYSEEAGLQAYTRGKEYVE